MDNIKQALLEKMADFLDGLDPDDFTESVPREESELHIRMAEAAFAIMQSNSGGVQTGVQEIIDKINTKLKRCTDKTALDRRVKGVYVDCLVLAKDVLKNLATPNSGDGEKTLLDIIDTTGERNILGEENR